MTGLRFSAMNVGPLSPDKNLLVAFAPGHVEAPTTAAVIEHPKHGIILWDTGINEAVADPERGDAYWGPGLRAAFGTQGFTRAHVVDAQLDKLGIKPNVMLCGPSTYFQARALIEAQMINATSNTLFKLVEIVNVPYLD